MKETLWFSLQRKTSKKKKKKKIIEATRKDKP